MENTAPKEIIELVKKFERNQHTYKSSGYKEAQLREEFINPLFETLGWDIHGDKGGK